MVPGSANERILKVLETYPAHIQKAMKTCAVKTLDREMIEAKLHLQFKAAGEKKTSEDLKAMVRSSDERYKARLAEADAEAYLERLKNVLLNTKKQIELLSHGGG